MKRLFLLEFILSACAMAGPAMADVKGGVDAWARGDYARAVSEWRGPAIAGDADAQFNLGQAYKLGRGVAIDLAMAEEWYRKAAIQGHPQAGDNYGLALFQNGKRAQAVEWLEKSAARGEPRAQYVLGTMYFNGDVVKRDFVRAYALMTRASSAGVAQATSTLAQMDRYITIGDRQKGTELARKLESDAAPPAPALAALPATKAPVRMNADPAPDRVRPVKPKMQVRDPDVAFTPTSPVTPPRAAPKPAPATDGGWRVQLGTFRDPGNAHTLFAMLDRKGAVNGLTASYEPTGALTRLRAGPFASAAAAAAACPAIRRAGGECVPVKR